MSVKAGKDCQVKVKPRFLSLSKSILEQRSSEASLLQNMEHGEQALRVLVVPVQVDRQNGPGNVRDDGLR